MQHRVVIPYQHFGTTYQAHLLGSREPKTGDRTHMKLTDTFVFGWGEILSILQFLKKLGVLEAGSVYFQEKKCPTSWIT